VINYSICRKPGSVNFFAKTSNSFMFDKKFLFNGKKIRKEKDSVKVKNRRKIGSKARDLITITD
jgi:hypothetical protein